jgi:hypothetical protein
MQGNTPPNILQWASAFAPWGCALEQTTLSQLGGVDGWTKGGMIKNRSLYTPPLAGPSPQHTPPYQATGALPLRATNLNLTHCMDNEKSLLF